MTMQWCRFFVDGEDTTNVTYYVKCAPVMLNIAEIRADSRQKCVIWALKLIEIRSKSVEYGN